MLFGATGDLARWMVLPAFYRLAREGLLPERWLLVGNGRGEVAHEGLPCPCPRRADRVRPGAGPREWDAFAERVFFAGGGFSPTAPAACPMWWASPAGRWAGTRS